MSIQDVIDETNEDIEVVNQWKKDMYESNFSMYFNMQRELYERMKDTEHKITDEELENILTSVPLDLFTVSEFLSDLKLSCEVTKMKAKEKEADTIKLIKQTQDVSDTKAKELAAASTLEYKVVTAMYTSLIERVEKEIAFSKELIMGSKKIWDARKHSEESNPVGLVTPEDNLPDYNGQQYIK